ncbi:hypothetical protein [Amycolatopsis methanolica]|uniref:Uncharacterized protein n=1 Tax=Amycolatopsis methanolica 239 TaxID=1068978 RepID=A0A076MMI1_AMYME|nr:hypothetical protein [Amycolatopsis methanolica]AIJ20186.1 hypothetical protein AMETH_0094 [Amycolatopsis methanolica 239]
MGYRVAAMGAEALRRQNERWFTEPVFPNGVALVSPNTQLVLFTAESMIGPHAADRPIPGPPSSFCRNNSCAGNRCQRRSPRSGC